MSSWYNILSRLIRSKIAIVAAAGVPATIVFYHDNNRADPNFLGLNVPTDSQSGPTSKLSEIRNNFSFNYTYHAACKNHPGHSFDFIADAAEIALPAVVSIDILQSDFIFERKNSGSGFIVDKRGYIITNEHVVAGNRNVTVVMGGGRKLPGRVVAVDDQTDLALIKVESNLDLPEIVMGDDENLRPGQWVAAIGNGLHFPNTVTAGIISNVSRNITENPSVNYQGPKVGHSKYIQTDAAVNPGSSGGPLINLNGEVIAVNTMGFTNHANGIAFSIPISEVKRFLKEFSDDSQNQNANYSLGLRIVTITPGMANFLHDRGQLDPNVNSGIYVFDTMRNSPAHKKGFVKGDIIIAINNVKINTRNEMANALQRSAGKPVVVSFYRPQKGLINTEVTPVLNN